MWTRAVNVRDAPCIQLYLDSEPNTQIGLKGLGEVNFEKVSEYG